MREKSLKKHEKMRIETSAQLSKNNNIEEKENSFKFLSTKSKSLNKKYRKREEVKQLDIIIEKNILILI